MFSKLFSIQYPPGYDKRDISEINNAQQGKRFTVAKTVLSDIPQELSQNRFLGDSVGFI